MTVTMEEKQQSTDKSAENEDQMETIAEIVQETTQVTVERIRVRESEEQESGDAQRSDTAEKEQTQKEKDVSMETVDQETGHVEAATQQSALESYVDSAVKERIQELKKQLENDQQAVEEATMDDALHEVTTLVNSLKDTSDETGESLSEAQPMDKDDKPEEIPISKAAARNDPYSGYLAPNGRKTKRQKTRKQRIMDPSTVYNNVIVSYSQDTMPKDMQK